MRISCHELLSVGAHETADTDAGTYHCSISNLGHISGCFAAGNIKAQAVFGLGR